MNYQREFLEPILNSDGDFSIDEGGHTYHFLQMHIGKVKYIYMLYFYNAELPIYCHKNYPNPMKEDLVAVATGDVVYTVGTALAENKITGIEDALTFQSYVDDLQRAANELAKPMIDALPLLEESNMSEKQFERAHRAARSLARYYLLKRYIADDCREGFSNEITISYGEAERILCGLVTLEELTLKDINDQRDNIIWSKTIDALCEQYMSTDGILRDWEIEMVMALVPVQLNDTLRVENCAGDYVEIDTDSLIDVLADENIRRMGDYEWQIMGIAIEDIAKISFNEKVLYKKTDCV
jgi:hypothetical protein